MKKAVAVTFVLICLLALGTACIRTVKAQNQGDITINSDGSVTPSTAPIQQTGSTYTLTNSVEGSISVYRNNTILDGNGHDVSGNGETFSYILIGSNGGSSWTSNVTVENFAVTGSFMGCEYGIELSHTSNVIVVNNTIMDVGSLLAMNGILYAGIYVENGNSNIITGNNLEDSMNGLFFADTAYNTIVGNNITDMNPAEYSDEGIYFEGSSNNAIYHNNFINNFGAQADESGSVNIWDDGYPMGGNYWKDYQKQVNGAAEIVDSGIGNVPYVIDGQNKDRYPLLEPFNTATYLLETTPPKITVLSPLNQTFNESSVSIVFSVDKTINWAGYSLDGKNNVTVTGNSTITNNAVTNVTIANMTSGFHNITLYANDTFGNVGSSETVNFTIAIPPSKSFSIVSVEAVLGGAAVVVVCVTLLVYLRKRKPTIEATNDGGTP